MTGTVEIEVSPQEEMANPQHMKVFTVERHGLLEDLVSFRALCGVCNRRHSYYLRRIVRPPGARYYSGRHLCFRFAFS